MPVILPALPLWITPRAADDEHTDLSNGIVVPLQVKVRPPDRRHPRRAAGPEDVD